MRAISRKEEKALSPGRLTAQRFLHDPTAVTGLVLLGLLFAFSFLGGALSPYGEDQVFYRQEAQQKHYASVTENTQYHLTPAPGQTGEDVLEAMLTLALEAGQSQLSYGGQDYRTEAIGPEFFRIYRGDALWGIAHKDMLLDMEDWDYSFLLAALSAYARQEEAFTQDGQTYTLASDGTVLQGDVYLGQISRLVLRPAAEAAPPDRSFREQVRLALERGATDFSYENRHFTLSYDGANRLWSVREETLTRVWDSYSSPSYRHLLGTDKNGMDMLTRLMYGGRVSLLIGFVVVLIAGSLGVVLGGVAGYFGRWVDEAVMRLVDVFHCIPTTPILIILGAAMDGLRMDSQVRMLLMMLLLGFLGWPDIARLVRGQILSLREQDFMLAAEAAGLPAGQRIFRHLLPNVLPQLIVACTMRLGATILTEATLSFLGLGVKFPFASWGNIMNDVGNVHVLTSYWFVWIPAGLCLVLAVLGFHFVGDGLRDALDPRADR